MPPTPVKTARDPLTAPESTDAAQARILAGGGHIVVAQQVGKCVDIDLIVHDAQAGDNHWKVFTASRSALMRASRALQICDAIEAPEASRLALVLRPGNVEAAPMRVLVDALDDEALPTVGNSVEVATLIDYLHPTEKSCWNRLQRACQAAFATVPVTDDNWLQQLGRLAEAPWTTVEGWADAIACHVGASTTLRHEALACTAEQMRLLLSSRALPLDETARLAWAYDFAELHKNTAETAGNYLNRTCLNETICWADLPLSRVQAAWADQCLTEPQFLHVLGFMKAAEAALTLTIRPFGRAAASAFEIAVSDDPAERCFAGTLTIRNFPAVFRGTALQGPTFQAAGNVWRVDVLPQGVQLAAVSGPHFYGVFRAGVYFGAGACTYSQKSSTTLCFKPADAPWTAAGNSTLNNACMAWNLISNGLTMSALSAGSSRWLGSGRTLKVCAELSY